MNFEVPISVKRLSADVKLPTYGTDGAAGFDFYSAETVTINPFTTELVPTGLSVSVPVGFEIQIRPRSGLSLKTKMRIANSPGTIDSDYRGEIKIIVENTGNVGVEITKGDRIAQGVLSPVFKAVWKEEELEETVRGEQGFGSTGVN